jgi:hypothetical protein
MRTDSRSEEYLLAHSEALLAGTLALMTGQAQASCREARCLMTHRICANLWELGQHPALNADFRAAVRRLHEHWCRMEAELSGSSSVSERTADQCHPPSRRLQ